MKRTSLLFLAVALVCLIFADLDVTSGNTFTELGRIGNGLVTPDFSAVWLHRNTLLNTVLFAVCGLFVGVVAGFFLSFYYHLPFVRLPLSFVRSIHEIFWVLLFMTPFGLNQVTAILGIAIPYTAIIAKIYSEIIEESDKRPFNALPSGTGRICGFLFGIFPVVLGELRSYTAYRFECALRSSAVIGFVGFPTVGFHLESYFTEGHYAEAAALFYALLAIIGLRKVWLNKRLMPLLIPICFLLISWEMRFSWDNTTRLLFEMIPHPARKAMASGSSIDWSSVWAWYGQVIKKEAGPGLLQTVLLTQLALVATGLFTLAVFPFNSRHFCGIKTRSVARFSLIFLRTIPEYILAFVLILPLGPSLLPAIITIGLHNGAIVSHLVSATSGRVTLTYPFKRKVDRYLFEVVPKIYGQFLSFLFYRWEIILRESAILGVLGITTIGFYIDSAICDDRMDRAWLLICLTAFLNMGVDTLSGWIRKKLKITGRITTPT